MNVKPYILLGRSHLGLIKQQLKPNIKAWLEDWELCSLGELEIEISQYDSVQQPGDRKSEFIEKKSDFGENKSAKKYVFSYSSFSEGDESEVDFLINAQDAMGICTSLLGASPKPHNGSNESNVYCLSVRILSKLFLDFLNKTTGKEARSIFPDLSTFNTDHHASGSGSALVAVTLYDTHFYIKLSCSWLKKAFGLNNIDDDFVGREKLMPKEAYVGCCNHADVRLEVKLPVARLKLKDINSLCVGDVLKLECDLDEPLNLHVNGKTDDCKVYLGGNNGSKAVKIQTL